MSFTPQLLSIAKGGTGSTTFLGAGLPTLSANNTFTGTSPTFAPTTGGLTLALNSADAGVNTQINRFSTGFTGGITFRTNSSNNWFIGSDSTITTDFGLYSYGGSNYLMRVADTTNAVTWSYPAQSGTAEILHTFGVSDDGVGRLHIDNATATNSSFIPQIRGVGASTGTSLHLLAAGTTDTGTTAPFLFTSRIGTGTSVATRPLYQWTNNGTERMQMMAGGELSLASGPIASIHASAGQFAGALPKFEVLTGTGAGTYQELITVRHKNSDGTSVNRQLGIMFKMSDEGSASESNKSVGMLAFTSSAFSNAPMLSLVTANTRWVNILSTGNFLIGGPATTYGRTGQLFEVSSASSYGGATFTNWTNSSTFNSSIDLRKSRGTSAGSFTVVQSGDALGELNFAGADGTLFINGASIGAFVDGSPGANDMPGRLVFSTTPDGSITPSERLRINSAGLSKFTGSLSVDVDPTAINASAAQFASITPKVEIQTGTSTGAYTEALVLRHNGTSGSAATRALGIIIKLSSEADATETAKCGSIRMESTAVTSNNPKMIFSTGNVDAVEISNSGNLYAITGFQLSSAGTVYTQKRRYTATIDLASVAATSFSTQTFTVTGVTTADMISWRSGTNFKTANLIVVEVWVSASDQISIRTYNPTGSAVDVASDTWTFDATRS